MSKRESILIGTNSFSKLSNKPIEVLKKTRYELFHAKFKKFSREELKEKLPSCVGIIAGTENYDSKLLSYAKNLKVISRIGVGIDNIDLDYTKKNNIAIKTTQTDLSISVAELTVSLILSLYKNIIVNNENVKNKSFLKKKTRILSGKTVGVLGLGRIGKASLKFLKNFNCKFLAFDHSFEEQFLNKYNVKKTSIKKIFANSDVICIHLSYSKELYHLVNYDLLKKCKKTPVIINTARGDIVSESALIRALDEKIISGAGIDVFEDEPYSGPLIKRKDVVLTPHVGSFSREIREKMEFEAVNSLLELL